MVIKRITFVQNGINFKESFNRKLGYFFSFYSSFFAWGSVLSELWGAVLCDIGFRQENHLRVKSTA
jgi:hypothetical protein